jgi:hypothetical protein
MKRGFPSYIAVLFITTVIFLVWRMLLPGNKEVQLVNKEPSKGKITRKVTPGVERIQVSKKRYNRSINITKQKNDNAYMLQDSTEDYNLEMFIKPRADSGLVKLDYSLDVKAKKLMRVDTVSLFRVDTLKMEKVKVRNNPFYDTFWFGSAVTTLVIFLFSLLIK